MSVNCRMWSGMGIYTVSTRKNQCTITCGSVKSHVFQHNCRQLVFAGWLKRIFVFTLDLLLLISCSQECDNIFIVKKKKPMANIHKFCNCIYCANLRITFIFLLCRIVFVEVHKICQICSFCKNQYRGQHIYWDNTAARKQWLSKMKPELSQP